MTLTRDQTLQLAELMHMGMRGRAPASETEMVHALDLAPYVADWFAAQAKWTPPGEDTVTLTIDEVRVVQEQLVAARQELAVGQAYTADIDAAEAMKAARDLVGDAVRALATCPPDSWMRGAL